MWLIPVLLTLHNAEEAIGFRRAWSRIPSLLPEPLATFEAGLSYDGMLLALIVVSLLGFLLALAASVRPTSQVAMWLLLALEAAVAINVVAHMFSAIVLFRGYAPGLVTAFLFNAPFAWYVLRRARDEAWVSRRAWRALAVGGIMLHGPVLVAGLAAASRFRGP